jgi:SAM-dependent methyltransferase
MSLEGIRSGDFVLEIGSGDNPNPHSHVLVDKFYDPSPHRKNTPMKIDDRPVIVADVERLPFKDRSFDYVICSHLIEHIPNVEQAFSELVRIARSGYIETPSIYAERIVGKHDIHLWYVYYDGNQLFLNRKTSENISPYSIPEVYDYLFSDIFWTFPNLFFVRYEWSGNIDYKIISDEEMKEKYAQYAGFIDRTIGPTDVFEPWRLRFGAFLFKREILNVARKIFPSIIDKYVNQGKSRLKKKWQFQPPAEGGTIRTRLESILCCPDCRGNLKKESTQYVCLSCKRFFDVRNGIPNFL